MEVSTRTLSEVMLGVHFESVPISFFDLSAWCDALRIEYPTSVEQPQAPPVALIPGQHETIFTSGIELPRITLRNGAMFVQLQHDRFIVGWSRLSAIGETETYVGYDELKARFQREIVRFYDWIKSRMGLTPASKFIELSYHNAIPMDQDGRALRIGEVFNWVAPKRLVNGFGVGWMEIIDGDLNNGRVISNVNLGILPPATRALQIGLAGICPFNGLGSDDEALIQADKLHRLSLDIFESTITLQPELV